ncbi:dicarboxylate/amino acid:cation symporter [Alkalihalophilus marmarensis]|uniref:dicarboxylate/amino acid:cation symporter n=1 Tax=Alkalihalophilus marmarensis TaxID=521377 RepID=UPI002DB88990|nr:dicarboxylate/amino acid:cation symporter [Alkalihalophilus marmarensis]MEC2070695.1 dicarboxylate/amino acid:cation symporter [Alkalihalophilus marmarensis]
MKRPSLLTQILLAFVLAIIVGSIFGSSADVVSPLGTFFLRLIQFVIAPLILATLVTGIASLGSGKKLARLGAKTVGFFLTTTLIAVSLGLAIGFLFSPGEGLNIEPPATGSVEVNETEGVVTTLLNIIPTNPFAALAEQNILQIIFFAAALGIGITIVGEKAIPVRRFFAGFADVLLKITGAIMKLAPIGVFGIMAPIVGNYGLAVLLPLGKVILAVAVACILHVLIVYGLAVKTLGKTSLLHFFKGMAPAALVGFTTSSSAATLPVTLKNAQERVGVSKETSSFVLPLGATINMDGGAIYQGIAVLFIAQFYGIELTMLQIFTVMLTATLASIGAAGVPGAGLIMLAMVLSSAGLPIEGIALVAAIDRILDMFRTGTNILGDAAASVVIDRSENKNKPIEANELAS